MIKMNKHGFTLSEALITLSVIGVLALLVLPGVMKDSSNKATTALLQNTVTSINDAVQNELISNGTKRIEDTKILTNPDEFFSKHLDVIKVCKENAPNACYAKSTDYKTLNGTPGNILQSKKAVLLRSGVAVDIIPSYKSVFNNKFVPISIDLNGAQPPNITGVDRQIVCLAIEEDLNNGIHVGDVGGCVRASITDKKISNLKTKCKSGNTEVCYYLLEMTGFDQNYLKTN